MSLSVQNPRAGRQDQRVAVGGVPRVNLLPPEIALESKLARQRRALVFLVFVVVAVVVLGYVYMTLVATTAQVNLDQENAQTAAILEEQAKYTEVIAITNQLDTVKAAQVVGSSTSIDFKTYLSYVQDSLPDGSSMTGFSIAAKSPDVAYDPAVDSAHTATVATMNFAVKVPNLADLAKWLRNLETIPGYATYRVGNVQKTNDSYTVDLSMLVDTDALVTPPAAPAEGN
jgi:hypothetical protein